MDGTLAKLDAIDRLCSVTRGKMPCVDRAQLWVSNNVPGAVEVFETLPYVYASEEAFLGGPWWTVAVDAWLAAGAP